MELENPTGAPSVLANAEGSGPQGQSLPATPMPRPSPRGSEPERFGAEKDGDNMPSYLHSYTNIDNFTCGQAAIATVADYLGTNVGGLSRSVFDGMDGLMHWDNQSAVSTIKSQYGPDVLGGWCGTSGGRIQAALQAYGLEATAVIYSGLTTPWETLWQTLQSWVQAGWPCPVLLEADLIPGYSGILNLSGHWPVLFRIDDQGVHLANCSNGILIISVNDFLRAWNYLAYNPTAYGYNHCAVIPCTRRSS